ncbi:MAG: dockerin type I repeat-containing protein, partial [Oscillospiraceae bacterium]|nr:dockerin type I repeat-containing protein [Oscillospiraceae bacterium]
PGTVNYTFEFIPRVIEPETVTGSITTVDEDDAYSGSVVYYTAPADGTVTITLTSEDTEIEYNITINSGYGTWYNTANGEPNTQTFEVSEGDDIVLIICTLEALESYVPGTVNYEISFVPAGYEEETVLYGDVNGDGKVNVLDANLVRRHAAELIELDETQAVAADVNGDGKVNVLDANLIRRYAAELISVFPIEE